jgi:hypothetical protein
MSILKSIQSGNFTDSSTWAVIDSSSFSGSGTISLNIQTSVLSSSNFTVSSNITISGVMIRIASRTLSPSGTLTLSFRNVTTLTDLKTISINVSDIPDIAINGFGGIFGSCWIFFKFDSYITLSTTQTYQLRANTSASNQITIYTASSSVWDKALVTTTNSAPAGSDTLYINGENTAPGVNSRYTVTMNVTSSLTAYGATYVDTLGTLRWADTPGSTFHLRLAGNLEVRSNGILIIGDDITPIPANTNCYLEITCSSPIQYRILLGESARFITRGFETIVKSEINGSISAGATSFNTSTTTDWSSGDTIVIAGTSRAGVQNDVLTVSSRSGNTINTTTPFLFSHLGTGDIVADSGKLNRNVRILSTSPTNPTNIFMSSRYIEFNVNYTEFFNLGHTNITSQSVISLQGGNNISIRNSSLHSETSRGVNFIYYDNNPLTIFIDNNIFFRSSSGAIFSNRSSVSSLTNFQVTITNNLSILTSGMAFSVSGNFNGNTICGSVSGNNVGISLQGWFSGTMDNTKIYSVTRGITIDTTNVNNLTVSGGITINNLRSFRNSVCGIQFNSSYTSNLPLTFINARLFGSARSIDTNGSINGIFIFKDSFFWGGSGEISSNLLVRQGANSSTHIGFYFDNCKFGLDYNNNVSNFSSAILLLNGLNYSYFNNCVFSGTEASTPGIPIDYFPGYVSLNHNGVTGSIRTFKSSAILNKDTTILYNNNSTIRITPQSSTFNAISDVVKVPVKSNETVTISVTVRKSTTPDTSYNGTQPQLVYLYNPASGNNSSIGNIVVATCSSSNGIWETLTYTTPLISTETVLDFYILCNGTTGFINIADWKVNRFNNSISNQYFGIESQYSEPDFKVPGGNYAFVL